VSDRAREYVSELGAREVTTTEKLVMLAIAEGFSDRYGTANVASEEICDYAMITRRHFRRIMAGLQRKGLVEYRPGVGKGVYCSFVLTNLALGPQEVVGIETGKETKRGHKGDIKRTFPTPLIRKEDLNQDQSQNLKAFDSAVQPVSGQIPSVSSSAKPEPDDDIGVNPADVARVLRTYCESPVTTGKANAADEATARDWLGRRQLRGRLPGAQEFAVTPYTVRQIENGIVLATARRMGTQPSAEAYLAPVRSLQYFYEAVREALADPNCTDMYISNCRRAIERLKKNRKKPQEVAVG
jgi:hypothetical protein